MKERTMTHGHAMQEVTRFSILGIHEYPTTPDTLFSSESHCRIKELSMIRIIEVNSVRYSLAAVLLVIFSGAASAQEALPWLAKARVQACPDGSHWADSTTFKTSPIRQHQTVLIVPA